MVSTKNAMQKNFKRKIFLKKKLLLLLLLNLFRKGAHMGKIRLKKDRETKKQEKILKELLYTAQMAHWYSGSKISKTSNSSNSSSRSNNSNFGGSGLAGPPITVATVTTVTSTSSSRPPP